MEGYLVIFFVLLARCCSRSYNDTNSHTQNQTDFSKRGFSLGEAAQALLGKQTTAIVAKLMEFLEKKILKYGMVKIKIWNKTPYDLVDAKWSDENLAVEAPPLRTVESQKGPVDVVAHYMKIALLSRSPETLWVSYNISLTHRVCIYVKLQAIFQYTVYVTGRHRCDEPERPPDNVFVSKNEGNGYQSYWRYVDAKCAMESHEESYSLNVYILNFDDILPPIPSNGKLQAWTEQTHSTNPDLKQVLPVNENEGEDIENQMSPNNQLGGGGDESNQQPSRQPVLLSTVSPSTTMVTRLKKNNRRIFMDNQVPGNRRAPSHKMRTASNGFRLKRLRPMLRKKISPAQFSHQPSGNENEIPNHPEMMKSFNNNQVEGIDDET